MGILAECQSLSVYGKISCFIYYFILIFGGMTTVYGMVAPLQSADCMGKPFLSDQNTDQIIWFKAMGRMCGALATLFLIGVYLLGHSMKSLFLLFLWGMLNFLNFALMIPQDLKDGGSEEAERCNNYMKPQVGAFAVLEAIGVLFAWLDQAQSKSNSFHEPLSSSE